MLQFNVQALLDKKDKTRYWLVKQMGTDYATVNKICDNASKSVRIDTLERLMKALDCEGKQGPGRRRTHSTAGADGFGRAAAEHPARARLPPPALRPTSSPAN